MPAALLLMASLFGIMAVGLMPRTGATQCAVLGPLWLGPGHMLALVDEAGGILLNTGGWHNVVIARSDDPGFAAALYRAGAWLVLDAVRLRGCLGGAKDSIDR
ncbi:hypothetical protein JMJ55_25845 [Belnapia sp. T6]|uniref:Uncharacterized protein n=1 Tax=Belnapia mucosa TaxID=2804532 RepID=A0ABS1VAR6_9PROT|nr:hypothetical protein [Belnapia mucosa]MBL6458762.1 hypothetical protein [Belnapia mucosa]